ncbi:hypothetical protein CRE_21546 [Caenorhabditis remanei]|uniref:Uncharacterized protein n=1 Tax=Caenorhabditis remanei TaxID=31234 RepID=E3NCP7_CAERE|nr:hypothetical protein CRE_21546 [Caenorhabditis remanei]
MQRLDLLVCRLKAGAAQRKSPESVAVKEDSAKSPAISEQTKKTYPWVCSALSGSAIPRELVTEHFRPLF